VKAKKKAYREANKEQQAAYYEANKEKLAAARNVRVQCPCGCWLSKHSLLRHQRSQTHIDTMTTMEAATLQAPPAEAAAAEH